MSLTTTFDPEQAERGLRFLSKKDRGLHPRAQVQKLRRIAVRATKKADWRRELEASMTASGFNEDGMYTVDPVEQAALRMKADLALEACKKLNAEHRLGY